MSPGKNNDKASYTTNQRFPLADNLANIPLIRRMWRAQWPEFSWVTVPGDPGSRCYQMFAPDISRVGYGEPVNGNQWTVYSIMCPQQGHWLPLIEGTLNVEVTVTSSGGTVTEEPMTIDAQMTIQPKIWFSPDTLQNNTLIRLLWQLFNDAGIPFPSSKANAMKLTAFGVDANDNPVIPANATLDIKTGLDPNYPVPSFATHHELDDNGNISVQQAYVAVEIGELVSTGSLIADEFNTLVMKFFNLATGNLLQNQNVLSWNVWVIAPEAVFTEEWQNHADYWRFSLDVNHRSPEGNGRDPQYFDGKKFNADISAICNLLRELKDYLAKSPLADFELVKEIEKELDKLIARNCNG